MPCNASVPSTETGACPSVVSTAAPISRSGCAIRSIGRCERLASPVRAVDDAAAETAKADTADDELVRGLLLHLRAESTHRLDRRERVLAAAEAADARLAVGDGAEEHRAMRDRLVAGHGDVPVHLSRRF